MNLLAQAQEHISSKNFEDAKSLLEEASIEYTDNFDILLGLGIVYLHLGEHDNAEKILTEASETNNDSPAPHMYLANLYYQQQKIDAAIEEYQLAIANQADIFEAHYYIASLYMTNSDYEDARYHYEYAIKLQPGNADCLANLGQVFELTHELEEARQYAQKALNITKNHIGAQLVLGKVNSRENKFQSALTHFEYILNACTDMTVCAIANIEKGHILDRLKRYDEAYSANVEGKKIWAEIAENIPFDKTEYQTRIQKNTSFYTKQRIEDWEPYTPIETRVAPVFFVGFPRSGTTLAEQILNTHDNVFISGEKPLIQKLIDDLQNILQNNQPYPEIVESLSKDDISKIRNRYWELASSELPDIQNENILIDKLPLNIIEAGLINRIFPDSKILVAIRDPRDCCLSAFMQSFVLNPAMINFLSMQKTVDFYCQTMELWLNYRERITSQFHEFKYEDIVSDFDRHTKSIFRFLELDYPEKTSDFHITAKSSTVVTPSYQDVTSPVYDRSNQRWRNYTDKLEPYNQQLMPYIKAFNYETE